MYVNVSFVIVISVFLIMALDTLADDDDASAIVL